MKILKVKSAKHHKIYKRKSYPDNNSRLQYIPLWNTNGYFVFRKYKTPKYIKNDALNKKTINIDSIDSNELIYEEPNIDSLELREAITQSLSKLTPREERVLRMRFGIGMMSDHTAEEVGQVFSLTRSSILQIEARALTKLKRFSKILKEVA